MRHKQRPVRSSRHKSVTFIIDSHTSFGDSYERHMSDVMRLAFLENNDISIDDCSNIDFNSLSTASILQRNIQQQLQQERREQLRQQQQRHLHQQQRHLHQQQRHLHQQQRHLHQQQQFQQQFIQDHQEFEQELDDDYDPVPDYEISDSSIFATASTFSSAPNRSTLTLSSPMTAHQQPSSSHVTVGSNRHNRATNAINSNDGRKRTRDSNTHVEFSDNVKVETIQNYGDGFFCDEPGCGKSFPSLRKLRHHKVVHSDEFPFVCEFRGCAKKFKRKFGIDLHSTTHFDLDPAMYSKTSNNSSLPFFGRRMQYSMCKPCGQKFKTVHEYQYHMLKHGKEPFKCPVKGCGQTFGIWKSFQKHRASHYFNYYCKMDPRCDHHTSNLQLLKLHIYCCHFRRKLPENATLSSKDPAEEESPLDRDEHMEDVEASEENLQQGDPAPEAEEDSLSIAEASQKTASPQKTSPQKTTPSQKTASSQKTTPSAPRRDSRLRKNPPRSSTFGQQDYASINNGSSFVKSLSSTPQIKRTRSAINSSSSAIISSSSQQSVESHAEPAHLIQEETVQNYGDGFFCDEPGCGKSFPSLRKLRHHKVVHSDEFPFVCEFRGCAKKFKRKFGIDLHSTTHFDLDPAMYSKTSNNSSLPFFGRRMQYSMCKPCGQKFKTVHEYQYHMLKHGKEPFKCPVKGCGQTFGIWKSFQKHRASHYFNYYCKMDPHCGHHTSNLQLLKLHIYCCHFRRKLPENATLSSKDPAEEESPLDRDEHMEDVEASEENLQQGDPAPEAEEDSLSIAEASQKTTSSTPRRDSRLRKNPPRSSTFGQQDYASINNGSSFAKSIPSTPEIKRTRSAINSSSSQQSVSSQSTPPEKKVKLPLKILPKRNAQRLPMSLIADDASTEDDAIHSSDQESLEDDRDDEDADETDPAKRNKFKCHLCDYKFSVRFQLTKHLSTHLELTPEMYSKTADKHVVQLSERRRRDFSCDKCRLKFEQMSDLDEHMQKDHGNRPYVCNFCQVPSTFSMAKQYLSHLYEHRFIYKCTMAPDCDFTINRKDALKLHIFRMHLNQQLPPYIEEFANLMELVDP